MDASIRYTTFENERLGALQLFWNNLFSAWRNFVPVSIKDLKERIIEKRTAVEHFIPEHMHLAWDGERVVGLLHGGVREERLLQAIDPSWAGGDIAYVGIIGVLPSHRRRGIGAQLMQRFSRGVEPIDTVTLDGRCLNIFYGNSDAPCTPLFGTPEGVSVNADDQESVRFFKNRGYSPIAEAVSLELSMADYHGEPQVAIKNLDGAEFKIIHCRNYCPVLGASVNDWKPFRPGANFDAVVAVENDVVVGSLIAYRAEELAPDRFHIFEFEVLHAAQGRGYGRGILTLFLELLRKRQAAVVETLTLPESSAGALALYQAMGFRVVHRWLVY